MQRTEDQQEERLIALESIVSYQDQQLAELNYNYQEQQKQLFKMETELERLKGLMRNMQSGNVKNISDETPPPHY